MEEEEYSLGLEASLELAEDQEIDKEYQNNLERIQMLRQEIEIAFRYHSQNNFMMEFAFYCEKRINIINAYNYHLLLKRNIPVEDLRADCFAYITHSRTVTEIGSLAAWVLGKTSGDLKTDSFIRDFEKTIVAEDAMTVISNYVDFNGLVVNEK